jgi:hypothetical protein
MLAIPSHNFEEQPLKDMMQNYIKASHNEATMRSAEKDIQDYVDMRHQILFMVRNFFSVYLNAYNLMVAMYTHSKKAIIPKKYLASITHK